MDEWIGKHIRPQGEAAVRGAQEFINIITEVGGEPMVAHQQGSIYGLFRTTEGKPVYPLHLWNGGGGLVSPSFKYLTKRPKLTEESSRQTFYDDFVEAVGPLTTSNLAGFPAFRVAVLATREVRTAFAAVAQRFVMAAMTD